MGGAGGIEDRDGAAFVAVAAGVVAVGRSERGYGCGNFLDLSVQGGLVVLNLDDRGDAAGGDTGFDEQRLRRRDFVGFLCDVDMRQHERRVGGERAQHLGCDTIVEAVEAAAQRLAIQGNGARALGCTRRLQQSGMATEHHLDLRRIEALENGADSRVGGRAAPLRTEGGVQRGAMHVDEGDDAAI